MAAKPSSKTPGLAADPVEAAAVDVDAVIDVAGIDRNNVISRRVDVAAGRLIVVTRAGQKLSLPVGGGAG